MSETPSHSSDGNFSRSTPSGSPVDILSLASRQLDGDLTKEETRQLEQLSAEHLTQVRVFQRQTSFISALLKNAPLIPIEASLISGVALPERFVEAPSVAVIEDAARLSPPPRRKFASVVSMLVMTGCLLVALIAPPTECSNLPRITASWKVQQAAERATANLPADDSWNVVVVQMDDHDRARTMQKVRAVVRNHGFEFARSAGEEMPTWLGVVLSADASESLSLIKDIQQSVPEGTIERDPMRIAESSREELIAAVRESLQYPTQSELHHGKVYLAMPDIERGNAEQSLVAAMEKQTSANTALTPAAAAATNPNMQADEANNAIALRSESSVADVAPRAVNQADAQAKLLETPQKSGVVLVVFQFASLPASDHKI